MSAADGGVESVLWLMLALHTSLKADHLHDLVTSLLVGAKVILHLNSSANDGDDDKTNRWKRSGEGGIDADGFGMGCVLVHTLLQGMGAGLEVYAVYSAVGVLLLGVKENQGDNPLANAAIILATLFVLFFTDDLFETARTIPFVFVWWSLYQCTARSSLAVAVTRGEWFMVSNLIAVAVTELITTLGSDISHNNLYGYVAATGLVGCALACFLADALLPQKAPVLARLVFVAIIALGMVEIGFWWNDGQFDYPFPRCLYWIFGDFLLSVEASPSEQFLPIEVTGQPRVAWLVYWLTTLAVLVPLAPSNISNPILARKWFHLVAVILFVPATVAAPEMMSLSYAIALSVLLLLESTRHHVPWLNDFYSRYVDADGKNESASQTIVSHMALIAGCALPLWIAQWLSSRSSKYDNLRLLLSLWGVWVTGVGDAMGAVVGKTLGKAHWGQQRRTVEGSIAMLVSLCGVCALTARYDEKLEWNQWLPACVLATLLEAFTLQIDNLVLPLAGVAMILVM